MSIWIDTLAKAVAEDRGNRAEGTIVIVDFLPAEEAHLLREPLAHFLGDLWEVHVVGTPGQGAIGADAAVDLREDRSKRCCFIVIRDEAGAGLQGVYDVGDRVEESSALGRVKRDLLSQLKARLPALKDYAEEAFRQARRAMGTRRGQQGVYEEILYLCEVVGADNPVAAAGEQLPIIGLIPTRKVEVSDLRDLARNAECVSALLAPASTALETTEQRVEQLKLADEELAADLTKFLRGKPLGTPKEWLGDLLERELDFSRWRFAESPTMPTKITVRPFRKSNDKPYTWTGLFKDEDREELFYCLEPAGQPRPLEVRWDVDPPGIEPGACRYSVTLVSTVTGEALYPDIVEHRSTLANCQKWRVDPADLADYQGQQIQVRVVVELLTDTGDEGTAIRDQSEEFTLTSEEQPEGQTEQTRISTARSLADVGLRYAMATGKRERVEVLERRDGGYVVRCGDGPSRLVHCGPLARKLEEALMEDPEAAVALQINLAADGTARTDTLARVDLVTDELTTWDGCSRLRRKLVNAIKSKAPAHLRRDPSTVECLQLADLDTEIREYARAYTKSLTDALGVPAGAQELNALERARDLLRIDTVLLQQSEEGADPQPLALLVAPTHPLRALWLLGYERLLSYWCGGQERRPEEPLDETPDGRRSALLDLTELEGLAPHNFPAFLSWEKGSLWQFFGNLGLYWAVLLPVHCPNPQAAMAAVRTAFELGDGDADEQDGPPAFSPETIAAKIKDFLDLHSYVRCLRMNVLNAADGEFVKHILTRLPRPTANGEDKDETDRLIDADVRLVASDLRQRQFLGMSLERLFAARQRGNPTGRREADLLAGGGTTRHPHFRWARAVDKLGDAHISLLLDAFPGNPYGVPAREGNAVNAEAYGLALQTRSEFSVDGGLGTWVWWVQPCPGGNDDRHPAEPRLTRELADLHTSILKLSCAVSAWQITDRLPAVRVQIDKEQQARIEATHQCSDWVLTLDRCIGAEYFDQPTGVLSGEFERYLIDYTPEYAGAMNHRLLVSTDKVIQLQELVGRGARDLGMGDGPEVARQLVRLLKSVSGHLVLQAWKESRLTEILALAIVRHWLETQGELKSGFLVPVDSHARMLSSLTDTDKRCDLIRVYSRREDRRERLAVDLIEVKHRAHRSQAVLSGLMDDMRDQTRNTDEALRKRFFPSPPTLDITLRRRLLVDVLRFYMRRARRNELLTDESFATLDKLVDGLLVGQDDCLATSRYRALVYCPSVEDASEVVEEQYRGDLEVRILGRKALPEKMLATTTSERPSSSTPSDQPTDTASTQDTPEAQVPPQPAPEAVNHEPKSLVAVAPPHTSPGPEPSVLVPEPPTAVRVQIGIDGRLDRPVYFCPTVKGNPHLLIVGIPGMGKTTAVVNIVVSLARQGVYSLLTDFHGDLTRQAIQALGPDRVRVLNAAEGLPFNPMHLTEHQREQPNPWTANAIDIAEIWRGIFSDFGDIQTSIIRTALLNAYREAGFSSSNLPDRVPPFRRFFDMLDQGDASKSAVQGVRARLETVFLMNLFTQGEDEFTMDQLAGKVVCLDLHGITQESNQLVAASMFLHKIYREMFLTGERDRLERMVVFDEAHRAAGVGLIGRLMQECRKFGIGAILSSQRVSDFSDSILETPGNHLCLQVNTADAQRLAHLLAPGKRAEMQTTLQSLGKFRGVFRNEDHPGGVVVSLAAPEGDQ